MIGFTLSMPNVGSWNGRWSGENEIYFVSRKNRKKEAELDGKYFRYNFGDGWSAGISCKKMSSQEANKLRKKSKDFCGYEWMVDSILENNKIICPE